ncbi:hypothetical protein [Streptomyces sp. NPDC002990]
METRAYIPRPRAEAPCPPLAAAPDPDTGRTDRPRAVTRRRLARPGDREAATAVGEPLPGHDQENGAPGRSWRVHVVMLTLSTATVITAAALPWA